MNSNERKTYASLILLVCWVTGRKRYLRLMGDRGWQGGVCDPRIGSGWCKSGKVDELKGEDRANHL